MKIGSFSNPLQSTMQTYSREDAADLKLSGNPANFGRATSSRERRQHTPLKASSDSIKSNSAQLLIVNLWSAESWHVEEEARLPGPSVNDVNSGHASKYRIVRKGQPQNPSFIKYFCFDVRLKYVRLTSVCTSLGSSTSWSHWPRWSVCRFTSLHKEFGMYLIFLFHLRSKNLRCLKFPIELGSSSNPTLLKIRTRRCLNVEKRSSRKDLLTMPVLRTLANVLARHAFFSCLGNFVYVEKSCQSQTRCFVLTAIPWPSCRSASGVCLMLRPV